MRLENKFRVKDIEKIVFNRLREMSINNGDKEIRKYNIDNRV